ncbi:MAG: MBL fold metallo-hydrolase [Bacteroidales bacterium]|nr:MBL fold metallo-hydrolase [Bacteroidales bacterium]
MRLVKMRGISQTYNTKITFLGTGTSQGVPVIGCSCEVCRSTNPKDNRTRASVFVETNYLHLLIDAGPDLRQQLLRQHIMHIDALLLTHEHKDHTGGIDDLRPVCFLLKKSIPIYGQRRVLHVIAKDYDYAFKKNKYPGVPELKLCPVDERPFYIEQTIVKPVQIKHLHLNIFGYRVGNFAYITDASFIPDKEKQKLQHLDMLVLNALRKEEHYSHFNLKQALSLIEELQPRSAYLTHIGHDMGLYEDISKELPAHVFMAYDGLEVFLP